MNRITRVFNPLLLYRAFIFSMRGLVYAAKNERAFQQETIMLVVGVIAAFWLTDSAVERAVLIGSLGMVLVVELINSAIEAVVDRTGSEQHPLSERAKDLGSAAVFVSLATAGAIWIVILI